MGVSPVQAIASVRFGGFGVSLGASSRFYKEKIVDKRTVVVFTILGAICSVIGSLTLIRLESNLSLVENFIGLAIILVGIPSLYIRRLGIEPRETSRQTNIMGLILLALVTVLVAAFGAVIGSLQMIILLYFFGMTALVASATRRAMQLVVTFFSLVIFISAG